MNKKTLIIIIALVVMGGAFIFINRDGLDRKEQLVIEQDLTPIELSQEEELALQDEGLVIPSVEEDVSTKDLQSVRSSDELDAIEADLNETDLSGLDAELEAIENDLSGL